MGLKAILFTGTLALAAAVPAGAQPLVRADLTGLAGWFNAHAPDYSSYDDWYNRSAYVGASLGWYWTDHLKTELEFGATSPGELYGSQVTEVGGVQTYGSARHRFTTRRIVAGQQYQFFRNAWAHPHAAAGVDLTWQTHEQSNDPVVVYDQASRTSRVVQPARTIGPSTELVGRPFAEIGTKLYLSQRAFFRSDLRVTLHGGVDEVLLRFGLGIDF
jgi:hypothetical protein